MPEPVLYIEQGAARCPLCKGEHPVRSAEAPLLGGIELADPCEPLKRLMLAGETVHFSISGIHRSDEPIVAKLSERTNDA